MQDITQQITSYLEAKRHLWNTYFRSKVESIRECSPLDEFEEIDRLLFSALVLKDLRKDLPDDFVFGKDFIPFLSVVPNQGIDSLELMMSEPTIDTYTKWNKPVEVDLTTGIEFSFIETFEWDRYGFVSFPYYLTNITDCPNMKDLINQKALIEINKVKVVCTQTHTTHPPRRDAGRWV